MKAIIIAAGASTRLRPLTENKPKCMLKINGKPLIQHTIELLRGNGINDISIIRGYKKEAINFPDITYFENNDFLNNSIVHSLICARAKLEEAMNSNEEIVISYSDILFNDIVLKKLINDKNHIAVVVDTEWQDGYIGRTDHPESEADNVIIDNDKILLKIGKNVVNDGTAKDKEGEFIGLFKFTPKGIKIFLSYFDRLNSSLKKMDPFQNAEGWYKSFIPDIFQEMIDQGEKLHCVLIQKNWKEFDTVQDFLRGGVPKSE